MQISNEESINSTEQVIEQSGRGAFGLARFMYHHAKKGAKAGEDLSLLSDACSLYRGGAYSGDSVELQSLIQDLTGVNDERLTGDFFFLGDNSDLSFFWKKYDGTSSVMLPKSEISGIEDSKLRSFVTATFTKAQLDGYLSSDGANYALTDKGRKLILKPDFILSRIAKECDALGIAAEVLHKEKEKWKDDRISAKLKQLNISESKYEGCRRATINKDKLFVSESDNTVRFYIPGTGRRQTVDIPKDYVIALDEHTYAAFIRADSTLQFRKNGQSGTISGQDLFKYYDDKTQKQAQAQAIKTTMSRADAAASRPVDIKTVYACDIYSGDLTLHPYRIDHDTTDISGKTWLYLKSQDGTPDCLLPQDAAGKIMFDDRVSGDAYISANRDSAADYADRLLGSVLDDGTMRRETLSYAVPDKLIAMDGDTLHILTSQDATEHIVLPKDSIATIGKKHTVSINTADTYDVICGGYAYKAPGTQIGALLKDAGAKPVMQSAAAAVQSAIPPVGAVTASAKIITAAVQLGSQAASQTVQATQSLSLSR